MLNYIHLLATSSFLQENGNIIAIAIVALIALIAFIYGLVKGFTRIGWGMLAWAGVSAMFYGLEKAIHDTNPILDVGAVANLPQGVQSFVSSLSIAVVSILVVLIVYALFAVIFRRDNSVMALKENGKRKAKRYEDDEEDYDEDDNSKMSMNFSAKTHICGFNRLVGGIFSLFNVVLILVAVICTTLVILKVTPLADGALKSVYEMDIMNKIWKYIHTYTLDFVIIGVIMGMAYSGYKRGLLTGFRSVFVVAGVLLGIVGGFYLPFSKAVGNTTWLTFVGDLSNYFANLMKNLKPEIATIIGKVITGAVLAIGLCVFVGLVNLILKLFENLVLKIGFFRFIDGTLSVVFMLIVGVAVCMLLVGVLYLINYYKIFNTTTLFNENSNIMNGIFAFFDEYLKPTLEKISAGA